MAGPYLLVGLLGSGGMGEVHLAVRPGATQPPVAVKTVHRLLAADPEFRARFRREVTAARAVHDPRTVAVLDADPEGDPPWLATAYAPGPSLAEAAARHGPLPEPAVRALGAELARGLAAVHDAHLLHRDVKPGNVLLTADGPRLIDFGIAQALDATALTATSQVIGTPGFMSPEQVLGERRVRPPADVFALAAVLCFAATGRGPFADEEPAAVLHRIARADADLSGVPPPLRAVLADALARDPERRPTASELADRLTAGRPVDPPEDDSPWPAGVRRLIAGHREAAERCVAALADAATVTAVTVAAPVGDGAVETAVGTREERTSVTARRPRGRRAVLLASLGVVLVVLVAVVIGRLPGGTGPDAAPDAAPDARPGADTGDDGDPAEPESEDAPALPIVHPDRVFGTSALDPDARPPGWQPWSVDLAHDGGPCSLGGTVLVCAGYEATVAVGAADGGELWRLEGGQHPGTPHLLPPRIVGDTVLVPGADALTAVELTSGKAQWEVPTEGERGLLGLAVAEGVLYTAHPGEGPGRLTVRARALEEDRAELWSARSVRYDPPGEHVNATRLVVAGDHLYVLLVGGTIAEEQLLSLDARTGAEGGRADCGDVLALPHAVVCRSPHYAMPEFVEVREPGTLALRWGVEVERTVPRFTVDDDDTLMLDPDGMSLVGYDLAEGYVRWRREVGADTREVLSAGGRVVWVTGSVMHAAPPGDPLGRPGFRPVERVAGSGGSYLEWAGLGLAGMLISGNVVYLSFTDGGVATEQLPP